MALHWFPFTMLQGRNLPSGVYFARVAGREAPAIARMVLIK
jgi:hypothetical protein